MPIEEGKRARRAFTELCKLCDKELKYENIFGLEHHQNGKSCAFADTIKPNNLLNFVERYSANITTFAKHASKRTTPPEPEPGI